MFPLEYISVLDHGYVKLIETWGSDERIIEAARMSTDKGFQGWGPVHEPTCVFEQRIKTHMVGITTYLDTPIKDIMNMKCTCTPKPGDEKLLKYLWDHKHATPFEMAGMTIEVQAPIFVFREWHRHRTQSYNELSARYAELPDMFYVPSEERLKNAAQSAQNKQSSVQWSEKTVNDIVRTITTTLNAANLDARRRYEELLHLGVAREIARLVIPVSQYSRMRASANLRNWLGFLTLRMDESAQWEIRQYANIVASLVCKQFPRTFDLFAGFAK